MEGGRLKTVCTEGREGQKGREGEGRKQQPCWRRSASLLKKANEPRGGEGGVFLPLLLCCSLAVLSPLYLYFLPLVVDFALFVSLALGKRDYAALGGKWGKKMKAKAIYPCIFMP